jgi:hypothetical protein
MSDVHGLVVRWAPVVVETILAFAGLALVLRPVIAAIAPKAVTSEGWRRVLRVVTALETVAQTLGSGVPPRKTATGASKR